MNVFGRAITLKLFARSILLVIILSSKRDREALSDKPHPNS